jgi:hypothetical protein
MPSAELAKRAAALETCKLLHAIKELDDFMTPIGKDGPRKEFEAKSRLLFLCVVVVVVVDVVVVVWFFFPFDHPQSLTVHTRYMGNLEAPRVLLFTYLVASVEII